MGTRKFQYNEFDSNTGHFLVEIEECSVLEYFGALWKQQMLKKYPDFRYDESMKEMILQDFCTVNGAWEVTE